MTELLVFLIVGIVFLVLFLLLAMESRPATSGNEALTDALQRIAQLQGLSFARPDLLLNDRDYQFLSSTPKLRPLAKHLRRERQDIVLAWLQFLQEDMNTLWRLLRFLVRHGAPTTFWDELLIGTRFAAANIFLYVLRSIVALTGPFVLPQAVRLARVQVDNAFRVCANLLALMPSIDLEQLERRWAAERT